MSKQLVKYFSLQSQKALQGILWTPEYATPIAWYDAADPNTIVKSGNNVLQWDDKSGNGRHMIQTNGSKQPEYVTNIINRLPSMYYSNTFDQMYIDLLTSVNVTQLTMVGVGMGATGDYPSYGYVKSTDGTDSMENRHQSGTTSGKLNASAKIDGISTSLSTANDPILAEYVPCISLIYYDGGKTAGRINGGALVTENTGAPDGSTFTIDRIQCGRQSNTPRNYQSEYIILDKADLVTIQKVEGYLAWKWGLENSLPVDHPYKNRAPLAESPAWTPAELSTALWLDAADKSTIIEAGGSVSQWNDKSGNGNHVTQGSGSSQPSYNATDFNGKPSLTFDGSPDKLVSTLTQVTTATIVVVIEPVTKGTSKNSAVMSAGAGFSGAGFLMTAQNYSTGAAAFGAFYQDKGVTNSIPDKRWNGDTASPTIFEKGIGIVPCNNIDTDGQPYVIGMFQSGGGPQDAYVGKIAEIIICDTLLDLAGQQRLEGYAAWKWGLESSLPADHPYKYKRPSTLD